jgi:hypothetical protein
MLSKQQTPYQAAATYLKGLVGIFKRKSKVINRVDQHKQFYSPSNLLIEQ